MPVLSPSDQQQSDEVGLHSPSPVQKKQEQVWEECIVKSISSIKYFVNFQLHLVCSLSCKFCYSN